MYICRQFWVSTKHINLEYRFKKIRQCQKERFNRQKEKEETNMVSEKEWLLLMVEKFLRVEEQKEERKYLFHLKLDIKNND
mgnify:CR=1 FL=1